MAQRGHELTTQLYIMNQMYSNSEGPNNNANAVRRSPFAIILMTDGSNGSWLSLFY